ncbi:MAG: VWA domain-containing protein, partial [Cyanobacteria bacterium]|nr:VWA domain-containing protein [Cyanobacteriota bacterium]
MTNSGVALGQGHQLGGGSSGGSKIFQTGTDSTLLQAGTGSTKLEVGTQSTMLEVGTESTMLQTGTAGALIQGGVEREAGPVTVIFLLDASLSMRDKLEGKNQKIDSAKQVLQQALMKIPTEIQVGVRVFGQAVPPGFECQATSLLVPPGIGNRRTIIEKIRRIIPTGMTPLTLALFHAAERDLRKVQGKKTIILITDGAETC